MVSKLIRWIWKPVRLARHILLGYLFCWTPRGQTHRRLREAERYTDWWSGRESEIVDTARSLSLACREWLWFATDPIPACPAERGPMLYNWICLGSARKREHRRLWRELHAFPLLRRGLARRNGWYYWTARECAYLFHDPLWVDEDLRAAVRCKTVFKPYVDDARTLHIIQSIGDLRWVREYLSTDYQTTRYKVVRWSKPQNRNDAGWTGEEPRDVLTLEVRRSALKRSDGWEEACHRHRETAVVCEGYTAEGAALDEQGCSPEEAEALIAAFGFSPEPLREDARWSGGWYEKDLDYALLPFVGEREHGDLHFYVDVAPDKVDDLYVALECHSRSIYVGGRVFIFSEAFRTPEGYWEISIKATVQEIPHLQELVASAGGRIVPVPSDKIESIASSTGRAEGKGVEITVLDAFWRTQDTRPDLTWAIVQAAISNRSDFPVFYPETFSLLAAGDSVPYPAQTRARVPGGPVEEFVVEPGHTLTARMAFLPCKSALEAETRLRWQSRRHGVCLDVSMPPIRQDITEHEASTARRQRGHARE